MRNFQYRGAILTSPQTNQRGLMRCHSMIIWLILNALVNALALRSWCKTFTNAYFSSQWIFQVFLFNPLPEVAHYRNQASVKVDPDKPHTSIGPLLCEEGVCIWSSAEFLHWPLYNCRISTSVTMLHYYFGKVISRGGITWGGVTSEQPAVMLNFY